jgi:hypothetical protein
MRLALIQAPVNRIWTGLKPQIMKKALIGTVFVAVGGVLAASARADTITIGLGLDGGAITNVASGTRSAVFSGSFGAFDLNAITGAGNPPETGATVLSSTDYNLTSSGTTASSPRMRCQRDGR